MRIDQIKELKLLDIQSVYATGDTWLLNRRNDIEAVVERHSLEELVQRLRTNEEMTVCTQPRDAALCRRVECHTTAPTHELPSFAM